MKLELPDHLKLVQSELTAKEQEISKLTTLAEHAMEALLRERARANSAHTQCSQMANEVTGLTMLMEHIAYSTKSLNNLQ